MFILFQKTAFNITLACLGGQGVSVVGVKQIVAEIGGRNFIAPLLKKMIAPLDKPYLPFFPALKTWAKSSMNIFYYLHFNINDTKKICF